MSAGIIQSGAQPAASPEMARRMASLQRWRARSKIVRFYRRALPAAILAICICLVGWIGIRAALSVFADVGSATIRMLNPRFYGRDDNGRSYRLDAKEAVRDGREPDKVYLTGPGMVLDAGPAKSFKIQGLTGIYNQQTRVLQLDGHVRIEDGRGYRFLSDHAVIDPKKDLISGNSSVVGEGPLGRVAASSYAVYDQGARVVFQGNVHTLLKR